MNLLNYFNSPVERYGHIYHTSDGEEIHGIKKNPESRPLEGSFATVKWAKNLKTGALLARRICVIQDLKNSADTELMKKIAAEKCLKTLEELRNIPGIVPYHGYERYINKKGIGKIVFIFDKANIDLFYLLRKTESKPLDKKTQFSFAKQLLEVLHRIKGSHGDLKPDNILEKDGQLWLSDFDFYTTEPGPCEPGTIDYAAPEVLKTGKSQDLRKKDVWAAGIILFSIFTNTLHHLGTPPDECVFPWFIEKNEYKAKEMILAFDPAQFAQVLEDKIANVAVRTLISMMIQPDPAKRCTIDEAYEYFLVHTEQKDIEEQQTAPLLKMKFCNFL